MARHQVSRPSHKEAKTSRVGLGSHCHLAAAWTAAPLATWLTSAHLSVSLL